jgi:hypothetical protein
MGSKFKSLYPGVIGSLLKFIIFIDIIFRKPIFILERGLYRTIPNSRKEMKNYNQQRASIYIFITALEC